MLLHSPATQAKNPEALIFALLIQLELLSWLHTPSLNATLDCLIQDHHIPLYLYLYVIFIVCLLFLVAVLMRYFCSQCFFCFFLARYCLSSILCQAFSKIMVWFAQLTMASCFSVFIYWNGQHIEEEITYSCNWYLFE